MFAVRLLEFAGRAVHGDHADLFLRPFLDGFVGQLDGHVSGPFTTTVPLTRCRWY